MSDISAVVVVSYVKHWDNDTKGTYEVPANTVEAGVAQARTYLYDQALEESEDDSVVGSDPAILFTITKFAWGVPSNWLGVR